MAGKSKSNQWAVFAIAGGVLLFLLIPCLGIAAAVAIPAFINYTRRARTAEAEAQLRALFEGASSYYSQERLGPDGTVQTRCTVAPETTPVPPSSDPTVLEPLPPSFDALGWAPSDPVYYQYSIEGGPSRCGVPAGEAVYTFRARGDLDGDGVQSVFELAAGSDEQGLYRSPGLFIENELE